MTLIDGVWEIGKLHLRHTETTLYEKSGEDQSRDLRKSPAKLEATHGPEITLSHVNIWKEPSIQMIAVDDRNKIVTRK